MRTKSHRVVELNGAGAYCQSQERRLREEKTYHYVRWTFLRRQAIAAAMMLAAIRGGSPPALFDELSFSQKEMLAQFKRQLPMMPAKAYRWIAEMQEVAGFVGDDSAARELYEGAAHLYERIAEDFSGDEKDVTAPKALLGKGASN